MPYSTEQSKWNAFHFNDPFAADKFIVCHVPSKVCCRPNCDMGIVQASPKSVRFVDTVEEAEAQGFHKCAFCLAPQMESFAIDVDLLVRTVESVNRSIGFIEPLTDDDESHSERRSSVASTASSTSSRGRRELGNKSETDHLRLIDLACRHIALAAASSIFNTEEDKLELDDGSRRKKKKRGGVLGFKELAAKSKLSPWHFHRVFKSITGLTPKTYGDKCWDFLLKYKDSNQGEHTIVIATQIANPALPDRHSQSSASSNTLYDSLSPTETKPEFSVTANSSSDYSPSIASLDIPLDFSATNWEADLNNGLFVDSFLPQTVAPMLEPIMDTDMIDYQPFEVEFKNNAKMFSNDDWMNSIEEYSY